MRVLGADFTLLPGTLIVLKRLRYICALWTSFAYIYVHCKLRLLLTVNLYTSSLERQQQKQILLILFPEKQV